MQTTKNKLIGMLTLMISTSAPFASVGFTQPARFNYDESKVPNYELPDPLVLVNGDKVADAATWKNLRRNEILTLFEKEMYGFAPPPFKGQTFKTTSIETETLGGRAIRKEVTISFAQNENIPQMHLLLYVPANAKRPVPAFVGLNFRGNHTISSDPGITLATAWVRNDPRQGIENNRASEDSRGKLSGRWPVEAILARGYALATAYCGDIDPDYDDGFKNGVHGAFQRPAERTAESWGTIAAWAWGLSRAMDYFGTDPDIDEKRVAVMGHSRLGKTALWAGASDERFAIVISNNSGCGGAALSRRRFGETVQRINTSFPHWFNGNFRKYNDNEDALPIDQHMLIALVAPRPVLVCSAEDDRWADPRGEFLSAKHADSVYRLLGTDGIATPKMPKPNELKLATITYHIRPGKHDVLPADWDVYMDFADHHFGK